MKKMAFLLPMMMCMSVTAQVALTNKFPVMKQITPEIREKMLQATGGLISKPTQGPAILFLDLQKGVQGDVVKILSEDVGKVLRFPVKAEQGEASDVFKAVNKKLADKNIASVVAVIDQADFANILVAPENRWAVVNVAPLKTPGVEDEVLGERVRKEIWRAFGLMMGAGNTAYPQCPLKPVLKPQDLDAIKGRFLSPGPLNNIINYGKRIGLCQNRPTTYRQACQEGWAPAPTNHYQKAVWEEVKNRK